MKVGFIGTGRMGQTMVRRLLDAKHDVGVYNRTAEKARRRQDPVVDRRRLPLRRGRVYDAGRRRRVEMWCTSKGC
jgi:predicted dinucleotide-binding enzyme